VPGTRATTPEPVFVLSAILSPAASAASWKVSGPL
jgi:hypothetical protein